MLGHINLVAITGTIILVPYLQVKPETSLHDRDSSPSNDCWVPLYYCSAFMVCNMAVLFIIDKAPVR